VELTVVQERFTLFLPLMVDECSMPAAAPSDLTVADGATCGELGRPFSRTV